MSASTAPRCQGWSTWWVPRRSRTATRTTDRCDAPATLGRQESLRVLSKPGGDATPRAGARMTTYLVTGGTGFLGRRLLERLVRREDAQVFVLVRKGSLARL